MGHIGKLFLQAKKTQKNNNTQMPGRILNLFFKKKDGGGVYEYAFLFFGKRRSIHFGKILVHPIVITRQTWRQFV